MKSKVQRWGNSLAVRIPKAFAEEVGLTDDSSIEMRLLRAGFVEPSSTWAQSRGAAGWGRGLQSARRN